MSKLSRPYEIYPLGDSALLIDFGNQISDHINNQVIACYDALKASSLPGIIDIATAYSSLAIYYDTYQLRLMAPQEDTVFEWVKKQVNPVLMQSPKADILTTAGRIVEIPVWYHEKGLTEISKAKQLSVETIIDIHTAIIYKVYMIGFLPGFAYMGETDKRIAMPRKETPQKIEAGSVGIAGRQTGIYPFDSPGGWCIIGKTPLRMFDAGRKVPVLLQAGYQVKFVAINEQEYQRIKQTEQSN